MPVCDASTNVAVLIVHQWLTWREGKNFLSSHSVRCVGKKLKNPMSGLLLADLQDMTNSISWNPQSWNAAARVVGKTVLVGMTMCTGVGKHSCARYPLIQYWVNVRVSAEECSQSPSSLNPLVHSYTNYSHVLQLTVCFYSQEDDYSYTS